MPFIGGIEQIVPRVGAVDPARSTMHYRFCKTCGVRAFAQGDQEAIGGVFYAVAVAFLDDAEPDELVGSIKYVSTAGTTTTTRRQRIRDISDRG
jgi:hypothetical protein